MCVGSEPQQSARVSADRDLCYSLPVGRVSILVAALLLPGFAHGDGGVVRLRQSAGDWSVTLFSAEPLRAGPADLSVMVQEGDGGAVRLDGEVELRLWPPGGGEPRTVAATRQAATNKLLRAAFVDLDRDGLWLVEVILRRDGDTAVVAGELPVAAAAPRLAALWDVLLLPPAVVLLFALARLLERRRGPRRRPG